MNRITLSGYAGTGKSTVCKLLAQELDYEFQSVGNIAREYAKVNYGMSINEFQNLCRQKPELDDKINLSFRNYCNSTENLVADFRLGFHFVKNSFNVLLKASPEIAAKRLQDAKRDKEQVDFVSIENRNAEMRNRFIEKYGTDFADEQNYDLVINTDKKTPEEVAQIIISKFSLQGISTVNFHLIKNCNYCCEYCYARFEDVKERQLAKAEQQELIKKLAESKRFRKINFAGGEPTLIPYLPELVKYAKSLGLETSIVTNGSKIDAEWIKNISPFLDILALSVDTLNYDTNIKIGSNQRGKVLDIDKVKEIAEACHYSGIKLKINTVVSSFNKDEKLTDFINEITPFRWKILQATQVKGQNDKNFHKISVTSEDFSLFCKNNQIELSDEIKAVCESNDLITGSYVMVDFAGRFFDNSEHKHNYSDSILEVGVKAAFSQINVDDKKFAQREGNYSVFNEKNVL